MPSLRPPGPRALASGIINTSGLSTVDSGDARESGQAGKGGMSSHLGTPPSSHWTPPSSTHLRIRAFMSRSHDVRALSCPPSWSAWPLFVAGTRTRMSVPVIMPRIGDTWRGRVHQKLRHQAPRVFVSLWHWEGVPGQPCLLWAPGSSSGLISSQPSRLGKATRGDASTKGWWAPNGLSR